MSVFRTAVVVAPAVAPLFSGLIVNASRGGTCSGIFDLVNQQSVLVLCFVLETLWTETDAVDSSAEDGSSELAAKNSADPSQHLKLSSPRWATMLF